MFVTTVDVHLRRQLEVGLESAARTDVFQTVQNLRAVGARFLLSNRTHLSYNSPTVNFYRCSLGIVRFFHTADRARRDTASVRVAGCGTAPDAV